MDARSWDLQEVMRLPAGKSDIPSEKVGRRLMCTPRPCLCKRTVDLQDKAFSPKQGRHTLTCMLVSAHAWLAVAAPCNGKQGPSSGVHHKLQMAPCGRHRVAGSGRHGGTAGIIRVAVSSLDLLRGRQPKASSQSSCQEHQTRGHWQVARCVLVSPRAHSPDAQFWKRQSCSLLCSSCTVSKENA